MADAIVPTREAKGTDFCGTNKLYIVRSDLGQYLESPGDFNPTKGTTVNTRSLHPDCAGGDHYLSYLHAPSIGPYYSYFYIIYGNHFRRVTDLSTAADKTGYIQLHEKCRGGDFYVGTSDFHTFTVSPSFIIIFSDKGMYRVVSDLGIAENAKEYKLHDACKGGLYYWATKSFWCGEVWYCLVRQEAGEFRIHYTKDLATNSSGATQTFHPSLAGDRPWEYQTLFVNQAELADQLADTPGVAVRLSNELLARKMIGKAVRDAADIRGPHVTEIMRVQPILTAMLAKIDLNPKRYHELRAAMLVASVGVDSDVVNTFLPEKAPCK